MATIQEEMERVKAQADADVASAFGQMYEAQQELAFVKNTSRKQREMLAHRIEVLKEENYRLREAGELTARNLRRIEAEKRALEIDGANTRRDLGKLTDSWQKLQKQYAHMAELWNALQGNRNMRFRPEEIAKAEAKNELVHGFVAALINWISPHIPPAPGHDPRRGL